MSLDVCILAGGRGTRLKGIWDGPKCLVPVGNRPLLDHLFKSLAPLRPRQTTVVLGNLGADVKWWIASHDPRKLHGYPDAIVYPIEPNPHGTASALRFAIQDVNLRTPLLVLNGDTLPIGWQLRDFILFNEACRDPCNGEGFVAWHDDRHAGAAILEHWFLDRLQRSADRDLSPLLNGLMKYRVPGFLDVGTPDSFQRAIHLKEYP